MRKIGVSIIALFAASAVFAATADVEKRLREKYPSTNFTLVRETPIKGLYEVVMGRNVAYTDDSGRYMVFGHMYDMKEQKDLTALVLDEINKIDVLALPIADAIKTVRGNGERKLYVFSDPDCPFCRRLEPELAKIDNVTIYTFIYPLRPDSRKKAELVWCAKDRATAWNDLMESGKLPKAGVCDTPVERNIRLGKSLGINGTPTIITGDGSVVLGFIPASELERRLSMGRSASGNGKKGG